MGAPSLCALLERCWHRDASVRPSFQEIIKELEVIMVDVAVKDPVGQDFWKRHLRGKASVSWEKFREQLLLFHNMPEFESCPPDLQDQLLFLQHILGERKPNAP